MELQYNTIVLRCCDANMYRARISVIELAATVLLQKNSNSNGSCFPYEER